MREEYKYKCEDNLVVCVTKSESAFADTDDQVCQNTLKCWVSKSQCFMEHDWSLSGVGILSVWNTPHWYTTRLSWHGYRWACLSAPESMQFIVMDLHLWSEIFFPRGKAKAQPIDVKISVDTTVYVRHLTKLSLWGKIVSYKKTQRKSREILHQCWSPNL